MATVPSAIGMVALLAQKTKFALPVLAVSVAGAGSFVIAPAPSHAFSTFTSPDSLYLSSTTLIDISAIPEFTSLTSVTDGTQTVSFSGTVQKRQVGSSWLTWGSPPATESSTPPVLFYTGDSLTLSLSSPSSIFGFELQPNIFSQFSYTASYYSGASLLGSINRSPDGSAGALLYAASTRDITRVEISATGTSSQGFAIAQLRYGAGTTSVPGPLPILGVAAAFGFSRKLRKRIKLHRGSTAVSTSPSA